MIDTLSEREQSILVQIRDTAPPAEARRAAIILMSYAGQDAATIAAATRVTRHTVWRWRREWRKARLGIFPDHRAEAAVPAPVREPIPGVDIPRLPLTLLPAVGVLPDDPVSEAGRKVLHFHFERMLLNEPGSRLGIDIEAVHDMRVATRRMRSALRLFKPFFVAKAVRPFRDALREIAAALGAVRDLEVALDKAGRFAAGHPGSDLTPLLDLWDARLSEARAALIAMLDSKRFARFVRRFDEFLREPGAGARPAPAADAPVPYQVRHVAPRLIYTHYEQVRAYEPVLAGAPITTLHALRIDFKRLRYALEFFEEVLGPEAKRVIKEIKRMQDHLGDLNDADVAITQLHAIIDAHEATYSGTPAFARPDLGGVYDYAAALAAERQALLESFPEAWAAFLSDDVRRDLALAVAAL